MLRVVVLVLGALLSGWGVSLRRSPQWWVERSPATKYDPTVDRAKFERTVHRMGLWAVAGGATLVAIELIALVVS